MKSLWHRFTTLCGFSSPAMVFFAGLLSVTFFAVNSLGSQTLYALRLGYGTLQKPAYNYPDATRPLYYYYYIGTAPNRFEAFPVLRDLYTSNNVQYFPYGGSSAFGTSPVTGSPAYPYQYYYLGSWTAGNVPDDWTQEDVEEINRQFSDLSTAQKKALTGTVVAGNASNSSGDISRFIQFNKKTLGSMTPDGGVIVCGADGVPTVAYPDNTGYVSAYKELPDGSVTPVYYYISNNTVNEVDYIPTQEYSALDYDTTTQQYSLRVPDYREKLDLIANKIDGITLTYDPVINVSPPAVTVNPAITVNPAVTVSPDVTVNVDSADLSDVESSLVGIGTLLDSSLCTDSGQQPTFTNEVGLTQSEQTMISNFRAWETGIPVLGSTLDFGLTAIFGRLPVVGQDFEWMDIQPLASSPGPTGMLSGLRIRVDLTQYRNLILALRGWLIIAEAIYFGILVWKLIREALAV